MKTTAWMRMAIGLGLIASGCATATEADIKAPTSAFLGPSAKLLTPGDISKGQAGLRYFNPAAKWREYYKVIIEPVTFWGDDASKVAPPDQQVLTTHFKGALDKEFGERFELVTQPGPGVLRVQVAITDAEAATPGLRTVALVVPQMRMLNAAQSMASGKTVFAGGLQAEAKFTDSRTGQLLAAGVGRAVGGSSLKAAAQVEWGDAEYAIDLFAKRAAANMKALTSGSATTAQLPVE